MKKNINKITVVLVVVLALALAFIANIAAFVNAWRTSTPVDWAPFTAIYAALTVSFAAISCKKKNEQ